MKNAQRSAFRTRFRKDSIAFTVLKVTATAAAAGVAVAAFAVVPGLAVVAKELFEGYEDRGHRAWIRRQQRIREAIQRLARRRLVRLEQQGQETYLTITSAGATEVKKFDFEHLALDSPSQWDKKWRLVTFDIPEKHRKGRQALRHKLRALGFYPLQKSVFVYPHECRNEIDFVARFCEVGRFVVYLTCDDLGQHEALARTHFDLLLGSG